ncbi:MAG: hypothetical protein K6E94_04205 [Elusimicrobiaceae bacterium]|nr:hypothetical protein [Elusimicrobiaceae bacterium]
MAEEVHERKVLITEDPSRFKRLIFDPEGLKISREFAEFRPLIHAKPVEHDDKILSLYPINLRKND